MIGKVKFDAVRFGNTELGVVATEDRPNGEWMRGAHCVVDYAHHGDGVKMWEPARGDPKYPHGPGYLELTGSCWGHGYAISTTMISMITELSDWMRTDTQVLLAVLEKLRAMVKERGD